MDTERNVMRRTIRPRAAMIALTATFLLAALIECGAYELGVRAEARATAHRDLPANYCVKCHSDSKTIRLMLEKDDNNGTAAYCAGVHLPSRQEINAGLAQRTGTPSSRGGQAREPGSGGLK